MARSLSPPKNERTIFKRNSIKVQPAFKPSHYHNSQLTEGADSKCCQPEIIALFKIQSKETLCPVYLCQDKAECRISLITVNINNDRNSLFIAIPQCFSM